MAGEDPRLSRLEAEVDRAVRRNRRLRDKLRAGAEAAGAGPREPSGEIGAPSAAWSVQAQADSRAASLVSVPSCPSSAAPRHFPGPRGRATRR